jgi:hypothetical protein
VLLTGATQSVIRREGLPFAPDIRPIDLKQGHACTKRWGTLGKVHSSRPLLHGESVQKATDHILRWSFNASGAIPNNHVTDRLASVIPDHAFIRNLVYT